MRYGDLIAASLGAGRNLGQIFGLRSGPVVGNGQESREPITDSQFQPPTFPYRRSHACNEKLAVLFQHPAGNIFGMQKELLFELVKQNQFTSSFSFDRVTEENAPLRLNENTASIGFIFRHIGETMHLLGQFFGMSTDVRNTTIGEVDNGEQYDVADSRALIVKGFEMLKQLVEDSADEDWLQPVETPFFGTVGRIRLFAHVLFHNSHHAGQISMTLATFRRKIHFSQEGEGWEEKENPPG